MTPPILLDVTALVAAPYRSGIQRVERELLRHWPDPDQLAMCAFEPSGLIRILPRAISGILCTSTDVSLRDFEDERQELAGLITGAPRMQNCASRHVLNLELFYETWRTEIYLRLCRAGWRVQWLIYDFMPWVHPDLFPQGSTKWCMQYLRALRHVPEVAFISQQTRAEYADRVMRGCGRPGPVLPLGADGIGLERQAWSPNRREIVVIGTIEARKNVYRIMDAFRLLWARGLDTCLVFAGRVEVPERPALQAFATEAGPDRLRVLDNRHDGDLRAALRRARAVLYASEIEGFGLPPYEAMHCGIPCIAAETLPSMQLLPPRGHIRLTRISSETLADAVQSVMDDKTAERLWADAAGIVLPTWRDFAHAVAEWSGANVT
jgi:glycosyltransferase involved in cell wall biosynthesis